MKLLSFLCIILLLCSISIAADDNELLHTEYSYKQYTSHDGLHHLLTTSLYQDDRGFLWISTAKGFTRFDGNTFTPFLSETMESFYRIEDAGEGKVRAFGDENCYIVDKNDSLHILHLSDSLVFNPFNSELLPNGFYIYESAVSQNKYMVELKNDNLHLYLSLPDINRCRRNRIYWSKTDNLLYIPTPGRIAVYDMQDKGTAYIENINVETFLNHSALGLLALGNNGLYKINGTNAELYIPYSFKMANKQMLEAKNGEIYLRDFQTIYRIRDEEIEPLFHDSQIMMWYMLFDNEENLWMASYSGLYNLFRFDFNNYFFENHKIKTVSQDEKGDYWFAGMNDDIFRLSEGNLKLFDKLIPDKIPTWSYASGSLAHNGKVYFPIRGGMLIAENNRFRWADLPLEHNYRRVMPYENDILIVAGDAILHCDKDGNVKNSILSDKLKQYSLYDMETDSDGRWIACGEKGLSIVKDSSVYLIDNEQTKNTYIICKDQKGNIWSGSENRLNLLRDTIVETVYSFSNQIIVGLQPFGDNQLIAVTLKGFYILDIDNYLKTGELHQIYYDNNNGMTALEPMINAITMDGNGNIWIPTDDRVVSFNPQHLIRQQQSPILNLLAVQSSTDNINWTEVADGNLTVNYKNKNFRFSYIGICYSATKNINYQYRLTGFQDNWSQWGKRREVLFNNLKPGKYEFQLRANAGTPDTETEIIYYPFEIKPAFWQTWWFIAVSILLFSSFLAFLIYSFYKQKLRKQMEKVKREAQLNDLKVQSIRLRAIPHFNANVLNGIEYYLQNHSKEVAEDYLLKYSNFMNQTLRDVNKASNSLENELRYVKLYLSLEEPQFNYPFEYKVEVVDGVDISIQIPNMALHTYSENAVKHGLRLKKEAIHIFIYAENYPEGVKISVEDNGIGREEAAKNTSVRSSKQGLSILMQQIELYNQQNEKKIVQQIIDLKDENNKPAGTRFELYVPAEFTYF